MIHVLLPPAADGTRLEGDLEEALLLRHDDRVEDDEKVIVSVEYCLASCAGPAHQTGAADRDGCFCSQHVHRSVHATMKRWPEGLSGIAQPLGV